MNISLPRATLGLLVLAGFACGSDPEEPPDTGCRQGICGSSAATSSGGSAGTTGSGGSKSGSGGSKSSGGSTGSGGSATGGTGTGGSGETGGSDNAGGAESGGSTSTGGSGGSGGSGATGGSATGGSNGGTGTGGSAGSGSCVPQWLCSSWETDGSGDDATRTCTDTNDCGTNAGKPPEQATLPALDMNFYKCNVEPVMNRKCSMLGCHGTEEGRALRLYSRGRLRITGEMLTATHSSCPTVSEPSPSEECIGSIECRCYFGPKTPTEWQRNFDSARGFLLDASGAPIPSGEEDQSDLLAQPVVGGKAHAGIHLFRSGDAEYDTILEWLQGATLSACDTNN